MGSAVRGAYIALLSAPVFLAGCSFSLVAESPDPGYSERSVREMCDFPVPFLSGHFKLASFEIDDLPNKTLDDPIEAGNVCSYDTPAGQDREHLSRVALWRVSDTLDLSEAEGIPTRRVEIDGATVIVHIGPMPGTSDPQLTHPSYTLNVVIDGWGGELAFKRGDDASAQAGAEMLVRMVRALKG